MVWLASRCVGRWPSGAPLALTPDTDNPRLGDRDDFLYKDDAGRLRVPARRARAPRQPARRHQAVRDRAIAQHVGGASSAPSRAGVRPAAVRSARPRRSRRRRRRQALAALARRRRGARHPLLLREREHQSQFEFVQQTWCNNPRFGGLHDNKDPIAGNNGSAGDPPSYMTIPGGPAPQRTAAVPRFVTVKGGAYFFMPGLAALRFLAAFRAPA